MEISWGPISVENGRSIPDSKKSWVIAMAFSFLVSIWPMKIMNQYLGKCLYLMKLGYLPIQGIAILYRPWGFVEITLNSYFHVDTPDKVAPTLPHNIGSGNLEWYSIDFVIKLKVSGLCSIP